MAKRIIIDSKITDGDAKKLPRVLPNGKIVYYRLKGDLAKAEADFAKAKELGHKPE